MAVHTCALLCSTWSAGCLGGRNATGQELWRASNPADDGGAPQPVDSGEPQDAEADGRSTGSADASEPPSASGLRLREVTSEVFASPISAGAIGLLVSPFGQGAAIGDLDGDGWLDLVLARTERMPGAPKEDALILFHSGQEGSLQYEPAHGLDEFFGPMDSAVGVALGDYDRDGDLDLFLACAGRDLLLRNEGDRSFVDVSDEAGVAGPERDASTDAVFADLNNDGLLDLYVSAYLVDSPPLTLRMDALPASARNRLYLNRGDGSFEEVPSQGASLGATHTAAVADLDADGQLEILVANDVFSVQGETPLEDQLGDMLRFKLPRDAIFDPLPSEDWTVPYADVADEMGIIADRSSMGIGFWRLASGEIGVYITDYGENVVYVYDEERGNYEDRTADLAAGLSAEEVGWGAVPLDLDGDDIDELIVVNGTAPEFLRMPGNPVEQVPTVLKQGVGSDVRATRLDDVFEYEQALFDPVPGVRGAYLGDLDRDGDLDLLVSAVGNPFRVFRNDSAPARFLDVRLRGTVSAPDPVGATVELCFDTGDCSSRQVVAGGETYGQSDRLLRYGRGDRVPQTLTVHWPSGYVQSVPLDADEITELEVREPEWLRFEARIVGSGQDSAELRIELPEATAVAATAGGQPLEVRDEGAGVFVVRVARPAQPAVVPVALEIDGTPWPFRPWVRFE